MTSPPQSPIIFTLAKEAIIAVPAGASIDPLDSKADAPGLSSGSDSEWVCGGWVVWVWEVGSKSGSGSDGVRGNMSSSVGIGASVCVFENVSYAVGVSGGRV